MGKGTHVPIAYGSDLFGEKFLGREIIHEVFGFQPDIPEFPTYWNLETLEYHAELGHILVYNPDRLPDGKPFDLQEMTTRVFRKGGNAIRRTSEGEIHDRFLRTSQFGRNGKLQPTACFLKASGVAALRAGWQIVSPLIACETRELNAVERFDWLVENMWRMVPVGGGHFNERAEATREWKRVKSECQILIEENRYPEVAERLANLRLNRYIAEPVANAIFRYILYYKRTRRKLFCPELTSSCNYTPEGKNISFGMGRGRNVYGESSEHNSGSMILCCGVGGRSEIIGSVMSRMNF